MMEIQTFITLLLLLWLEQILSFSHILNIQVCNSKECMKQFSSTNYDGNLVQMLTDLLLPIENNESDHDIKIGSCGCLSNCSKGPNVLTKHKQNERLFHDVKDVQTAAAILDVVAGIDCPIEIMVAVSMMSQVGKISDQTRKIEILNKIILSLEKSGFSQTNAMSHALLMRAIINLDGSITDPNQALKDASKAAEINHFDGRAYRVTAHAHESLGDMLGAMEAITKWGDVNPMFISKAKNELSRLSQKVNP